MIDYIGVLITSGIMSIIERSILAIIQLRQAPSIVIMYGLVIMILDGIKLFNKDCSGSSIKHITF